MSFTIVTLNCCLWPIGIRGTFRSAQKDERCKIIPSVLKKADIAICQEVFSWKWFENRWIAIMKSYLNYNWIGSNINSGLCTTTGLWTTTRFDILSQSFIPFTHPCLFSITNPLGFLHTTMIISNTQVHVINVHMLTDEAVCLFECFEKLYKQQIDELLLYIKSLKGYWIVGGDFNVDGTDLLIQWFLMQLKKLGKISYYHPEVNTGNSTSYANHTSKHMKVDQFYTNMEIKDCNVLDDNVSDHYPVMATIVLPSKFL